MVLGTMSLNANAGTSSKNHEDGYYYEMLIDMLLFPKFVSTFVSPLIQSAFSIIALDMN